MIAIRQPAGIIVITWKSIGNWSVHFDPHIDVKLTITAWEQQKKLNHLRETYFINEMTF